MYANPKKCVFAKNPIEYFGHWVSAKGVEADSGKIKAMLQWPIPKSLRELRGFLGLTGYYWRFVHIIGPYLLPSLNSWRRMPSDGHLRPMWLLKSWRTPWSPYPCPRTTRILYPFCNGYTPQGQDWVRCPSKIESQSHISAKFYLMAIVVSIQRWRHYLLGQKFIVRTNQLISREACLKIIEKIGHPK